MHPSYEDYVRAQTTLFPSLSGLLQFLERNRRQSRNTTQYLCVEHSKEELPRRSWATSSLQEVIARIFNGGHDNNSPFSEKVGPSLENQAGCRPGVVPQSTVAGRILIVEDIDAHTIEYLGATLDLDPMFFAAYIDTSFFDLEKRPPPPVVAINPSRFTQGENALHLHFQRTLRLSSLVIGQGERLMTDTNVPRIVKQTPALEGVNIGVPRSCCSVLRKQFDGGTWLCIILVDSTTADVLRLPPSRTAVNRAPQAPLQGGFGQLVEPVPYSNFTTSDHRSQARSPGYANNSLAQSLLHCFTNFDPPGFSITNPTTLSLAYYPIKAINSEWILYNLLMSRYVKHYQNAMYHLDLKLQSHDFEAMQPWRRRSNQSLHKLHLMHRFISRHRRHEENQEVWGDVLDDIDYLSTQIKQWGSFFDTVVSTATSILQLTDTRRGLIESAHVKQLTYMALVFIPLSFVASLFSMSAEVNPWGGRFWIYWAVAVPLLLTVLGISLLPLYFAAHKTQS